MLLHLPPTGYASVRRATGTSSTTIFGPSPCLSAPDLMQYEEMSLPAGATISRVVGAVTSVLIFAEFMPGHTSPTQSNVWDGQE